MIVQKRGFDTAKNGPSKIWRTKQPPTPETPDGSIKHPMGASGDGAGGGAGDAHTDRPRRASRVRPVGAELQGAPQPFIWRMRRMTAVMCAARRRRWNE